MSAWIFVGAKCASVGVAVAGVILISPMPVVCSSVYVTAVEIYGDAVRTFTMFKLPCWVHTRRDIRPITWLVNLQTNDRSYRR
jgi:hypothetical protein